MDGKQLGGLALGTLLVVVFLGIGVYFMVQTSYIARDDTTTGVNSITVAANGSLTDLGSSYPYVQDVTSCINSSDATDTLNAANYTVVTGSNLGSGGFVLKDSGIDFVGEDINCTVQYKKSTTASTAILSFIAIFGTIAGFTTLVVLVYILRRFFKDIQM